MVICESDCSLSEVDEALANVAISLKTDHYGNRLTWQKRLLLSESMDDLLDQRLALMRESVASPV